MFLLYLWDSKDVVVFLPPFIGEDAFFYIHGYDIFSWVKFLVSPFWKSVCFHVIRQHHCVCVCVCVRLRLEIITTYCYHELVGTSLPSWCVSSSDCFSSELHCCPVTSSPCPNLCISFVSWQMSVGMMKKSIHMIKIMKPLTVMSDLFVDNTCEVPVIQLFCEDHHGLVYLTTILSVCIFMTSRWHRLHPKIHALVTFPF